VLATVGAIAFSGKAIIVKLAYRYGVDAVTLIMYRMLFALPIFLGMAWVAWGLAQAIAWPTGLVGRLLECSLAGGASLLVYALAAGAARVPEMDQLIRQLQGQLKGRLPFAR